MSHEIGRAATTNEDSTPRPTPERRALSPLEERALLTLPLLLALFITSEALPYLNSVFSLIARGSLLVAFVVTWIPNQRIGRRVPFALGLVAIVACDTGARSSASLALITAYILGSLFLLEIIHRERGARWPTSTRLVSALLFVILSIGIALSVEQQMTIVTNNLKNDLAAWIRQRIVGFELGPMKLGDLRSVYQSRRIALRIDGPVPQRLRGQVLPIYRDVQWVSRSRTIGEAILDVPLEGDVTRVEVVRSRLPAVMLPANVRDVRVDPADVVIEPGGIVRTVSHYGPRSYEFTMQSKESGAVEERRFESTLSKSSKFFLPFRTERYLPFKDEPRLVEVLQNKVEQWTVPSDSPRVRMESLTDALSSEYFYSLDFDWTRRDLHPIVDFLEHRPSRSGHCEYFASALALLGRAAGVPTRVVTGYHVSEWNPIGQYAIVRERDAHAWTEAWLPGSGWTEFDPSPGRRDDDLSRWASIGPGFLDAVRRYLPELPLSAVAIALAIPVGLFFLVRGLRMLSGLERRRPVRVSNDALLEHIETTLRGSGTERPPWMSIEAFAKRVRSMDEVAAGLLERVSQAIYGTRPDDTLEQDVRRWSEEAASADASTGTSAQILSSG